jgi:hypothetical protein
MVVVEGCEKILPEFQGSRLGGDEKLAYWRTAVWGHGRKHHRTTYGACTLTGGRNVVFNEVKRLSS